MFLECQVKARLVPRRNYTLVFTNKGGKGSERHDHDLRHISGNLSPGMTKKLKEYYYKSNAQFFKLIGKDLGWNNVATVSTVAS